MTVIAIIQARMASTRLPGKILKEVNGKPLLLHQLNRIRNCKNIDQIVIATTIEKQDDIIVEFCIENSVDVFRGSENNVLERYYQTWNKYGGDTIVRLTSDCPIIDPVIIDETIDYFIQNDFDYVSNTINRTFPRGLDTEVFSSEALVKSYENAKNDRDLEHVTPYIYLNQNEFSIGSYTGKFDYSKYRWTVDTFEDLQLISNLLNTYYEKEDELNLENSIRLMEENPKWFLLNQEIEQKKFR